MNEECSAASCSSLLAVRSTVENGTGSGVGMRPPGIGISPAVLVSLT